jgi:nucleoside-diphosphate-sugar epimerase
MKVFVTGASGHIGSVLVPELQRAGHHVTGLARSDASAAALRAAGAKVRRGDLDDLDSLRAGATEADGVIHLAYKHGFSDPVAASADDLRAVEAMGEVLAGTGKPFVNTSGTLMLAFAGISGRPGTEEDILMDADPAGPRVASHQATVALAGSGVRSSVIRLAPTVHGPADTHGFIPRLISIARDKGVSGYVGDGTTHWPAIHENDAARLYRLALEAAPAGSVLHGAGDEAIAFRAIAEAIGRRLNVPVTSIPREEADAHFGFLGMLAAMDNPTSSVLTHKLLGWHPDHPGLLADLEASHYFQA